MRIIPASRDILKIKKRPQKAKGYNKIESKSLIWEKCNWNIEH